MTTAATIIADARDILLTRGWTQGVAEGPNGAVCLQQALLVACTKAMGEAEVRASMVYSPYHGAFIPSALATVTQIFNQLIGTAIPFWNDHPGTTFRDVLDLLGKAEARAKADRIQYLLPPAPVPPPAVWKMVYVPPPVMPAKHEEEKEEELALV